MARNLHEITSDDVHLWVACLDQPFAVLDNLRTFLSSEEVGRAERLQSTLDRNRAIASRGILRTVLACYLGVRPEWVAFAYSSRGKPDVAIPEATSIRFNLSHSGAYALIGVSLGRAIGVDLEVIRQLDNCDQLARLVLTARELVEFEELSDDQKSSSLLARWTIKEAYLKATGQGLTADMTRFEFESGMDSSVTLHVDTPGATRNRWYVRSVPVNLPCLAAVVVEGRQAKISLRNWTMPDNDRTHFHVDSV